ncbi:protein tramtrack: alpha-like isoform [Dinothrombium tinctorium]|uniref:Protein tramtrack: alpha-like isoform n=1 Tax=Dinothrombium tinctorium TaxID=1965070 RepID=A0A3S3P2F6_9ACAR|nr:protein tramtrack: alpha-like isoform [Dinothrombium tinctorium]RWS06799.1 protein tramtrack: alpha-like isoform [Dinothrombium tinctorium]RWS06802.1 protein tramtrack: alpha-like isoform [Dinothrombium tinctorium]
MFVFKRTKRVTVMKNIKRMYDEQKLCDFELIAGDRSLKCHKMVIAAFSEWFQDWLLRDSNCASLKLPLSFTFENVKAILDYIYSGEFTLNKRNDLSSLVSKAAEIGITIDPKQLDIVIVKKPKASDKPSTNTKENAPQRDQTKENASKETNATVANSQISDQIQPVLNSTEIFSSNQSPEQNLKRDNTKNSNANKLAAQTQRASFEFRAIPLNQTVTNANLISNSPKIVSEIGKSRVSIPDSNIEKRKVDTGNCNSVVKDPAKNHPPLMEIEPNVIETEKSNKGMKIPSVSPLAAVNSLLEEETISDDFFPFSQIIPPEDVSPRNSGEMEAQAGNISKTNTPKTTKCPIQGCRNRFEKERELRNHVRRCHEKKSFPCPVCKKRYDRGKNFSQHMLNKHPDYMKSRYAAKKQGEGNETMETEADFIMNCTPEDIQVNVEPCIYDSQLFY